MKEKIINYIETLEAKSLQVDDYFKQRNELYIENQKKDKEIERLNQEIRGLNNCIIEFHSEFCNKQAEINRLNNIINELEKYCNEEIEDYDKHINSKFITDIAREQYEGEKVCFEDMLGKLQELKGSDK